MAAAGTGVRVTGQRAAERAKAADRARGLWAWSMANVSVDKAAGSAEQVRA